MASKMKAVWQEDKPKEDAVFDGASILLDRAGEPTQWEANKIDITVGNNGSISLWNSSSEGHVYFYPQQLPHLAKALRIARKVRKDSKKP